MPKKQVVLLHSRQPLGPGSRDTVLGASELAPILLSDAQGLPFRDIPSAPGISLVVKPRAEWRAFVEALGADVEVVTNDEFCLQACRDLRTAMGLPERFPTDIDHYRDKWVMQQLLRGAGLPTPKSVLVPQGELNAQAFAHAADTIGGRRFILKPRNEANLRGIVVVDRRQPGAEQALFADPPKADYLVEAFIEGPQYHVECLVDEGQVTTLLAAQYIRPLLDLVRGGPSGSVTLDRDDRRWEPLSRLAVAAVNCLGSRGRFVAHVEMLSDEQGMFIGEVACRAPGGDVPWQALVSCEVDLEVANLHAQMGRPLPTPGRGTAAAWVWIPGEFSPPLINKTHGVFAKRFLGLAWLSPAKSAQDLWPRVHDLIKLIEGGSR